MKPWIARVLVCLGTIVALDQFVQYALIRDGHLFGRSIAPYDPPIWSPMQEQSLAHIRSHVATDEPPLSAFEFDSQFGWCPKPGQRSLLYQYDWAGCRIGNEPLSRMSTEGRRRITTIGCSFTLGTEVAGRDTWEAQLERLSPDLEIANLGVAGFGIDQALLRFRRDGVPLQPDEVWLGVQPGALSRIVTTYLPALNRWGWSVAFKPRFELGEGDELRLVPLPVRTLEDVARLLSSQADFVAAVGGSDRWVANNLTAYAPFGSSWMHRSSLARVVLTWLERRGRDAWKELRDPDSELFRLTYQICRATRAEASRADARLRVLILPNPIDLRLGDERGNDYWEPWVDALRANDFEVFDLSAALRAAGGAQNPNLWAPEAHYTTEGNRVVAAALDEYLSNL